MFFLMYFLCSCGEVVLITMRERSILSPLGIRTVQPKGRFTEQRRGKPPIPLGTLQACHILLSFSKTPKFIKCFALHNQQPPTHLALPPRLLPSSSDAFCFCYLRLQMSSLALWSVSPCHCCQCVYCILAQPLCSVRIPLPAVHSRKIAPMSLPLAGFSSSVM